MQLAVGNKQRGHPLKELHPNLVGNQFHDASWVWVLFFFTAHASRPGLDGLGKRDELVAEKEDEEILQSGKIRVSGCRGEQCLKKKRELFIETVLREQTFQNVLESIASSDATVSAVQLNALDGLLNQLFNIFSSPAERYTGKAGWTGVNRCASGQHIVQKQLDLVGGHCFDSGLQLHKRTAREGGFGRNWRTNVEPKHHETQGVIQEAMHASVLVGMSPGRGFNKNRFKQAMFQRG